MTTSFNSTMVRLKAGSSVIQALLLFGFQFHYGSIKGCDGTTEITVTVAFQFHYGSIKGEYAFEILRSLGLFQFHYGSIKGGNR